MVGGKSREAGEGKLMTEDVASVPEVVTARCTGCGRCVSACPERLFTLEVCGFRKHALLQAPQRCSSCQKCVAACPVGALRASPGRSAEPAVGAIALAPEESAPEATPASGSSR